MVTAPHRRHAQREHGVELAGVQDDDALGPLRDLGLPHRVLDGPREDGVGGGGRVGLRSRLLGAAARGERQCDRNGQPVACRTCLLIVLLLAGAARRSPAASGPLAGRVQHCAAKPGEASLSRPSLIDPPSGRGPNDRRGAADPRLPDVRRPRRPAAAAQPELPARDVHRGRPRPVRLQRLGPADQGAPPARGAGLADCPTGPDWYEEWRALPRSGRTPIRTYTVRAARPEQRRDRRRLRAARRDRPGVGLGRAGRRRRRGGARRPERALPGPDRRLRVAPAGRRLLPADRGRRDRGAGHLRDRRVAAARQTRTGAARGADGGRRPRPGRPGRGARSPGCRGAGRRRGAPLLAAVLAAVDELGDDLAPAPVADLDDVDIEGGILWEVPPEVARSLRRLRLAGRRGRRREERCAGTWSRRSGSPGPRSRSWATGGTGRPATDFPACV